MHEILGRELSTTLCSLQTRPACAGGSRVERHSRAWQPAQITCSAACFRYRFGIERFDETGRFYPNLIECFLVCLTNGSH